MRENNDRKKLQEDIFLMCASIVDSKNLSKTGPIDINELKPIITGENTHDPRDFDMEIRYLIEAGYFKRHAAHFVLPTSKGIDMIWGKGMKLEQKRDKESPAGFSISNSSDIKIKNLKSYGYETGIRADNVSNMDLEDSSLSTKTGKNQSWHATWWGKIVIGVLIAVVGGAILYYFGFSS